jgi:hypothetical protein
MEITRRSSFPVSSAATMSTVLSSWLFLIVVTVSVVFFSSKGRSNRVPPGPQSAWYRLGDHSHLVSRSDPWKTFATWASQYGAYMQQLFMYLGVLAFCFSGPIVFLQLGFTPVIR